MGKLQLRDLTNTKKKKIQWPDLICMVIRGVTVHKSQGSVRYSGVTVSLSIQSIDAELLLK